MLPLAVPFRESVKVVDRKTKILENEKLPFGGRYLEWKLGWDKTKAELAIAEYKKFLVLAYESKVEITPSTIVDEVWHYHILHTKAYEEFCGRMGRFLHHNPGGPGSPKDEVRFVKQYEKTLAAYKAMFGAAPPTSIWPAPTIPESQSIERLLFELAAAQR